MRVVFIGASTLTVMTADIMIRRKYEVVIVERDMNKIESLSTHLDCGFIHGDGTRPDVLRELEPHNVDILYCLVGNDQANLIASLVARSLGFKRVVTKIEDAEFEHVTIELGLPEIILPDRTISEYLADAIRGQDILTIASMIKGEARMHSFIVHSNMQGKFSALNFPEQIRVVGIYRNDEFKLLNSDPELKTDDEVILITYQKHIKSIEDHIAAWRKQESQDA